MKLYLSISALVLALPILQLVPPPPPQRGQAPAPAQHAPLTAAECQCSIDVTVKRQSNGEPISDVSITVSFTPTTPTPAGASATPAARVVLTATTDNAGHAVFSNLAEGQYSISAQREGFFGPATNGNAPAQVNASALIGPAPNNVEALIRRVEGINTSYSRANSIAKDIQQPVQHVTLQMIQGGIISGTVRDANHRPASGIEVVPLQITYQNGRRMMDTAAHAVQTDDLGEFRLFWFTPGEYYIETMPPAAQTAQADGPNFPGQTYYPGTMDLAQASPIVVREGEEVSGSDVDLPKSGGVTISGTVINTIPGRVSSNGSVDRSITSYFLIPHNPRLFGAFQTIPNAAPTGGRGTSNDTTAFPFEIRGVPPSSYDFYAIFNDGASPRRNIYTGHVVIDVGSDNISGIQAVIQPGVDLKVHFSVIGVPPPALNSRPTAGPGVLQNMSIPLQSFDDFPSPSQNVFAAIRPDADGIVTFHNLPDTRFIIPIISGLPADAYITEMRQGSRSILDDGIIQIEKETPNLVDLVISRGGGTISGTVLGAQGKPLTNARVNLIPDPPRRGNTLLYKNTTSSMMGKFTFQGVAPGAYKIFAWDQIPQGAEQNDEFVSKYDVLGSRALVSAGTLTSNIQVQVIPANR